MDTTPTTLAEGLANVKTQLALMRRSLQDDSIMDALKAASTLLSELRTSSLSPKMYFELCTCRLSSWTSRISHADDTWVLRAIDMFHATFTRE